MSKREKWGLVLYALKGILKFVLILAVVFAFTALTQAVAGVSYR